MKTIYEPQTFEEYTYQHIDILVQLGIWRQMSRDEKAHFRSCNTEIQIDNAMKTLRNKYI